MSIKRHCLALALTTLALAPAAGLAAGNAVTYEVAGASYEGYFVSPGADAPLVLLVHDWDGLGDYEVRRANMLAELGYAVFAVDLFGTGVHPVAIDERRALTGALYKDREKMRALLNAGLEAAAAQGAMRGNAVAMGYCFGGAAVLELARSGIDLKGFASFHGGLATPEGQDWSKAQGEVLVLHGTADTAITMDEFARLAKELEAAGHPHEMVTYSGAPHAFTVFDSAAYRADADAKSWALFTGFLERTLKNM